MLLTNTDEQTNRQTNADNNISLVEEIIVQLYNSDFFLNHTW